MGNQPVFRLNRQALIAALISAAFPIASHAAAGRVEFAMGNVVALSADGRERPLAKGTEINSGDTIQTADGRTQVKFTDGGYISLQPNTQFKVDDYAYEGKADGSEKGFFKLVKGSLRAITGAIGHTNKTAYRINTPVATIGIRGTELTGEYTEEGDKKELKVHVSHGSVFLENGGGDLILFQGQSGIVTGEGDTPGYSEDGPIVGAAGPDGGNPQEGQQEQQRQQDQATTFMAAEQYNEEGTSTALGGDDANALTLAAITGYHNEMAVGVYTLNAGPNSGFGAEGGGSGTFASRITSGSITADFGSYTTSAYLQVEVTPTNVYSVSNGDVYSGTFTASGSIAGRGFNLEGSGDLSNSGQYLCNSGCSFNATGLFSGPTAQNANINYEIHGVGGPYTEPHDNNTISGSAGFNASSTPAPPPPLPPS